MTKFIAILVLSMALFAADIARAEIVSLPANDEYTVSKKPFYEDGIISVDALKMGCGFSDARWQVAPALPAECAGYFRAVAGLFHSGHVKYLMSKNQCFDLFGEIPDWTSPIIISFAHHAKGEHPTALNALPFIIQAIVEDYPCSATDDNAQPIRGTLPKSVK